MALEDKLAATLRPSQPKIEEDKPLDKKPEEVEPNTQVGHALKDRNTSEIAGFNRALRGVLR